MPKKVEKHEVPEEPEDSEEVTCPVCGKLVGLTVSSCPHCGAEFEEEEAEEEAAEEEAVEEPEPQRAPARAAPAKAAHPVIVAPAVEIEEEETAECPVCGKTVSLNVSSCPFCGAEFEEEEVEEIIEVEEEELAPEKTYEAAKEEAAEEVVEVEIEEAQVEEVEVAPTASSIMDLRVIGMALIALGVIGSQISLFIDWYWTWVPPIESNLGMFVAIAAVVIVIGLVIFMLVKRSLAGGRKVPGSIAGTALSVFLFGIIALVLIMLWDPINSALQSSQLLVAVGFIAILVGGVLLIFMGMRTRARATA